MAGAKFGAKFAPDADPLDKSFGAKLQRGFKSFA